MPRIKSSDRTRILDGAFARERYPDRDTFPCLRNRTTKRSRRTKIEEQMGSQRIPSLGRGSRCRAMRRRGPSMPCCRHAMARLRHVMPRRGHAMPLLGHAMARRWHAMPHRWHGMLRRGHAMLLLGHAMLHLWHEMLHRGHAMLHRCHATGLGRAFWDVAGATGPRKRAENTVRRASPRRCGLLGRGDLFGTSGTSG